MHTKSLRHPGPANPAVFCLASVGLAYDERRATKDIDAVFIPKKEVYAAAARVAAALDLPDGWLNDAVKGFLLGPDRFPTTTLEMRQVELFIRSVMDGPETPDPGQDP